MDNVLTLRGTCTFSPPDLYTTIRVSTITICRQRVFQTCYTTHVAYVGRVTSYKTTDGRGNHRGHLMYKDADGVVNIVHGHQSRSKGAACIEGRVNRMCRREDAQQGENWDKGWECVWTNVPVDILTVIRLRYGRELHQ